MGSAQGVEQSFCR